MEGTPGSGITVRRFSPEKEVGAANAPEPTSLPSKRTQSRETGSTTGQIKVLLVDDHPLVREAVARILEDAGDIAVVAAVADGKAAVAAARSMKPDVAVMDVNMPGMNGVRATRAIRDKESAVKIIGLSIRDDDATRQAMLDAGACAYLLKGGPTEALVDTIRRCVDKRSPPPSQKR